MPFAPVYSQYDEELARRRAAQEALRQMQGEKAASGITDALSQMQALGAKTKQQDIENKRADAELTLRTNAEARQSKALSLEQAHNAAVEQNARDQLALSAEAQRRLAAQERATQERADAEAQRKAADDARGQALAHVKNAIAAQMEREGPKADITSVMNSIAGQPGFEAIRPEDVQAAHAEAVIEFNRRATERNDKDNAAALAAKAEHDANARGWAGIANDKERNRLTAEAAKEKKPAQLMAKDEMVKSASQSLASFDNNLRAYQDNTDLPVEGVGALVRNTPLIGRFANQNDQAKVKADAAAINALVFPILGRTDAPADQEIARLQPLMLDVDSDTPAQLAAKTATLRRMMGTGTGAPAATPATGDPAAAKAHADGYFGGGG